MAERRAVRSWRAKASDSPLKGGAGDSEGKSRQQTQQTQQTLSDQIGSAGPGDVQQTDSKPTANPPENGWRCIVNGCSADSDDFFYCARHRAMADSGELFAAYGGMQEDAA